MKRRTILAILATTVIASAIVTVLASSDMMYTWEKTFEVSKPEIECEIEIGDHRIVGCPVKVWVMLKIDDGCGEHCWEEMKHECDDERGDDWDDDEWEDDWDDDEREEHYKDNHDHHGNNWMECCQINGTYSAHLYWYNTTSEDWQHLMHLQEDADISLTCGKYMQMYTFTPEWEGEYKVVVNFTMDSETLTFTNQD